MPVYTPRLNYNGTDTLPYYTTANIFYGATDEHGRSLWMPNCTAYAYGRFNEIAGLTTLNYNWPSGDGEQWWTMAPSYGLQRGQVPQIGAAMSWTYTDGRPAGHVAVVEELVYDSNHNLVQIVTSNSAFNSYQPPREPQNAFPWFYLEYISPSNLDHWTGQHFQGFVYHPNFPPGVIPSTIGSLITLLALGKDPKNIKILKRRRR